MGRSTCRCGSTTFETVDITPVEMVDKTFFTRCAKCGLVVVGSKSSSKNKSTSKYSVLHLVHDVNMKNK